MVKIKMLKKYRSVKIGEIVESSKKSAENFVSQGYAEYVEEPKNPDKPDKKPEVIIYTDKKQLKELRKKYPSKNWEKELQSKIDYYNQRPFKESQAFFWLNSIKENVLLCNPKGRKDYKKSSYQEATEGQIRKDFDSEDLKTFIFDEDQIVKKKVFTSHKLNKNVFGFGILLPREEDVLDRKGAIVGQKQVWRPVVITSRDDTNIRRGLVISRWMREEFKIEYDNLPFEMNLRWQLKDVQNYLNEIGDIKVDGLELFNSIKEKYEHYCFYREKNWYDVNSLWDMGTYLHQLFSAYPLKEERGLAGTGKTKGMVVSSLITLNSTGIMANPSEATLFRITDELRPTKYIDEAEKLFKFTKDGIESDNRVELINSSYTKEGAVPRQEKIGNKYVTRWYHVYSPTRVASINGLYGATETRSITQIHTKSPDSDSRGELDPSDDRDDFSWVEIRNNCYRWVLDNWKEIEKNYLNFDISTSLKKRDLQIWKPLLCIAKTIDEVELFPRVLQFAEKISTQRKNDLLSEATLDYKYLKCLNHLLITATSEKIYVESIRKTYCDLYNAETENKSNKSISGHLDKLGFKDYRDKDRNGSYYTITKTIFDDIIAPYTEDFLIKTIKKPSQSSQSSHLPINNKKISDECMTNSDEKKEKEKKKCDECDESDESDDCFDKTSIKKPTNPFKVGGKK